MMVVERPVHQVHADNAEGFLLQCHLVVQHADMDDHLAVFVAGVSLKLDAHPAVTFRATFVAACFDRVGEREERARLAADVGQAFQVQCVLLIKHRLQPFAADVTLRAAVDRVAHLHIVSGHTLGDRAGGATDAKEPPNDFLSGADFREGSVSSVVQVNAERFLVRIEWLSGCVLEHTTFAW